MIDKKDYLEILKSITRDDVEKAFEKMLDKVFKESDFAFMVQETSTIESYINKAITKMSKTADFKRKSAVFL